MALDMKKFMARFIEEAKEHLASLGDGLVLLEKAPDDTETINAVFRSAHTIKGSSRMMKLTPITELAHKMEDALGALREGKIAYSPELADILLRGVDEVSAMVETVASEGELKPYEGPLVDELIAAADGREGTPPPQSPPPEPAPAKVDAPATADVRPKSAETIRVKADKLDELIKLMGEIISSHNRSKLRVERLREAVRATGNLAALTSRDVGKVSEAAHALAVETASLHISAKDDAVMTELLMSELQEKALMLRMEPLSTIFDPLPRMVRDVARSLGKEIEFVVEGGEIELDRKMMEKLGDPLVHMLRNSVDHGIETPDERRAKGKPEKGSVFLTASYDAGNVSIELADDGGGIPVDRVREKAVKKNILSEEAAARMPDSEAVELIFQPGFSTSAIITDLSGRGVGMDVARRNVVEELKGSINVSTKPGAGTSFLIQIPMTLAIMRVILVEVQGKNFAITARHAVEALRLPRGEIINVVDRKAARVREELIPVVRLDTLLGLGAGDDTGGDALLVILRVGMEKLGVVVDALLGEDDVVIKSLPRHMVGVKLVSGVTISASNEVVSLLHVPALMDAAKEIRGDKREVRPAKEKGAISVLVVDDSTSTREIERNILEANGYSVSVAADGVEALARVRERRYDCVITDVEMPRLDGFSLTERLRADDAYRDIPVIIVTSREKEEDKRRGIAVGANAYIVKGAFDQSSLVETVRNLVG